MNMAAFAMTFGATFFWAFSHDIIKLSTGQINSITFNTIQYSVLAIVVTPLVLLVGINIGSTWAIAMAMSFGFLWLFIGSLAFFYCLECAPAHIVVPISNISSVWGVIFAALLLGEPIGMAIPISLAVIVIGLVILAPRNKAQKGSIAAVILSVFVAILFGLTQITRKSAIMSGMDPLTLIWIASLTGSSLLIMMGLLKSSFREQRVSRFNFGIGASAGLLNVLVGGMLYLTALGLENAGSLAPVTSATMPFSFLLSIPLLRERPTKKAVIGIATMFTGVIIATL